MLTIRDTKTTPRPEKWRYPDVEGNEIIESSYMNLLRTVAQHYRTNRQEPPSEQSIIDYLCNNVAVACYEGQTPYRNKFTDPPSRIMRGKTGSRKWPFILEPMKLLAKPEDKGLGDIAARVVGPIGGDAYKKWHVRIFGKPCGCQERQATLNEEYPL